MNSRSTANVASKAAPVTLVSIQDITMLTARLAQILAEEADMLQGMRIKDINKLQKEKLLITSALEQQKKYLEQNPGLLERAAPAEKEEFRKVSKVFSDVLAENHRRLLIAKEINLKVVEAIAEVVTENATNNTYDDNGVHSMNARSLSVTLNEMI